MSLKSNLCKVWLILLLVVSMSFSMIPVYADGKGGSSGGSGDGTSTNSDCNKWGSNAVTSDSNAVYRVSVVEVPYPLSDVMAKAYTGIGGSSVLDYKMFWYNWASDEATLLPLTGDSSCSGFMYNNLYTKGGLYISTDSKGRLYDSKQILTWSGSGWRKEPSFKVVHWSAFQNADWGNPGSLNEVLNIGYPVMGLGFNMFNDAATKADALEKLQSIAGINWGISDISKALIVVERCGIISAGSDLVTGLCSSCGKKHFLYQGDRTAYVLTWKDYLSHNLNQNSSFSSIQSVFFNNCQIGSSTTTQTTVCGNYWQRTYEPMVSVLNPEGWLKPFEIASGYCLWGFAATGSGVATNTLAVYNAEPKTGQAAEIDKWEIYSSIIDGKMPDTSTSDCEETKFWNKTDWKDATSFLEAIDGSTSETLQNLDNGEYALIARDSYKNLKVPAYMTVLASNVVGNDGKAQSATKVLENPPEQVVWGSKTIQELTGSADSFGNALTIATMNGIPFAGDTSSYAKGNGALKGLQMLTSELKKGELTNEPILDQVNNQIKSAMNLSGDNNIVGEGIATQVHTGNDALGSAVEIVVKGKPVKSDLHVVSLFDGICTLTKNVHSYDYTNVNYGIVDPQKDSGVSDTVQAVILVPKTKTNIDGKITSSLQGQTPETVVPVFKGLSEDSRDGAPTLNVGNYEDEGYDIYVLIFSQPPELPKGEVELPDYLLNLYYNRVWFYTSDGQETYKINYNQSTHPMVTSDGDKIEDTEGISGIPETNECFYKTDTAWHTLDCGGTLSRPNGDHADCKNFFTKANLDTVKNANNRYWYVSYKDVSKVGDEDYLSRKWEVDAGSPRVYYLRASYSPEAGKTDTNYIWVKSNPLSLKEWVRNKKGNNGQDANAPVINTSTDATIGGVEAKAGHNILFDYAYNLTRSSSLDRRTLSGIGYSSISDSPASGSKQNMLELDFGDKPQTIRALSIGGERSSDSRVADRKENISFNSAFTYENGTSADDASANKGNEPKDAAPKSYPTSLACYQCNGGTAKVPAVEGKEEIKDENGNITQEKVEGKDEVPAVNCNGGKDGGHNPDWAHCPHCSGSHIGTSDDHVNWGSFVCKTKESNENKQVNNPSTKALNGFKNSLGSGAEAGRIEREFNQLVYKYATGSMPTGKNNKQDAVNRTKWRPTKASGDVTSSSTYRIGYVTPKHETLKYYPEVQMGYYNNSNPEELSGATIDTTYNGRNLLDSNKTQSDDGAAFNVASGQLYTMGEQERKVENTSLYLYKIDANSSESVHGKTTSDSMMSSSHTNNLGKVTIPAGTDMVMKAKPDGISMNLFGYSLDIIKTSDSPVGGGYNSYVKSGLNVFSDWGNSNHDYLNDFQKWVDDMTNVKNYNVDAILDVNNNKRGYNNFTAALSSINGGNKVTASAGGVYVLQVEHGVLQSGKLDYDKLMTQIAVDYDCSKSEAIEIFNASGIPQSIIDSLEHENATVNKSDGKGNTDGYKVHSKFSLGGNMHWYDEMTRTFVIRRFKAENISIDDIILQDKLDLSDSASSNYGSGNKQYGNDKTVNAKWYVSIFFTKQAMNGAIGNTLLTDKSASDAYNPASNNGKTPTQLINGQSGARDAGTMILSNAPVHGADFLIPSSTTSNFGD